MPCRSCQVGIYLAEDQELTLARSWHEQCKGKGCDCECPKRRGLLLRLWPFRRTHRLQVVCPVPGYLDCPACNESELEVFGGKWRCTHCGLIIGCCETDCPADGKPLCTYSCCSSPGLSASSGATSSLRPSLRPSSCSA